MSNTKQVWNVLLPGEHGSWWCFDDEAAARHKARTLRRGAQVSQGTSTLRHIGGEFPVWDTPRPVYASSDNTVL